MSEQTGSANFEQRIRSGYVVGAPVYAGSEPHHQREGDAWLYVEMHDAELEDNLTILFETENPVRIDELMLVWDAARGTRLRVFRNGVAHDIHVEDELVIGFDADIEVNGEWICYSGSLGRQ